MMNEATEQEVTRALNAKGTKVRETIFKMARSGRVFSIDDVIEELGDEAAIQRSSVEGNLISAARVGLLERLGKVKSRPQTVAELWISGKSPHRRSVQTYRGSAKVRKEAGK